MTDRQIMTATFQLGNSSSVRKRVTLILGDLDFTDLTACTFYIPSGQPLSNYVVRAYATQAWANATFSLYAATTGPEAWIRFDNATLARTPGAAIQGTECLEPGSAPAMVASAHDGLASDNVAAPAAPGATTVALLPTVERNDASMVLDPGAVHRLANAIDLTSATSARLTFQSWLSNRTGSRGEVQVSVDGVHWNPIGLAPASDAWEAVEVDLSAFAGQIIEIRFVLDEATSERNGAPGVWRIADLRVDVVR
jgi:hypothetical protein